MPNPGSPGANKAHERPSMLFTIDEIVAATRGSLVASGKAGVLVSGATWDSRELSPGDAYLALPGARVDGHDFALSACERGAACVLVSRDLSPDVMAALRAASCAVVRVDDTAAALVELARAWRGCLSGTVLGITGSSGKTTTKNLVRDVLARGMDVVATKANQNNELGVPRTLLAADEATDAVVVEMGMRGMGQIAGLCEYVRPDMGLVTNVGTSHIELLGSRENIALAKGELFDALPAGGIAFINAADDYTPFLLNELQLHDRGVRMVFYDGSDSYARSRELGIWQNADPFVWAEDIQYDALARPSFTIRARHFAEMGLPDADADARCALALSGAHNVANACAAAAVGLAFGLSLEQCCLALAEAKPESGRQELRETPAGVHVVDDSYNANPDSTRAALDAFARMFVGSRRIAVLGDMLELGDYAEEGHRIVGTRAAECGLELLVCVGDESRAIAAAARDGGMPADRIREMNTADEAAGLLRGAVCKGDAVLVKGSHSMGLARVVEELMASC